MKKYLFVVADFWGAGAQRQMYEIDCELTRRNIPIEILCIKPLDSNKDYSEYFYPKHIELNTTITFLTEICGTKNKHYNLNTYMQGFYDVFFVGEYVYTALQDLINDAVIAEKKIIIMCSKFQGEVFRSFPKNNKYIFISGFGTKEEIEFEFESFANYSHIVLPLYFAIDLQYSLWEFKNTNVKKIGIFTRLSIQKPLDPFFYTFQILNFICKDATIELHIFGAGTPEEAGYTKYLKHLGIENNVFFRGHQENMKKTICEEKLNLIWYQGYLNRPAGYAGFDAALTKTPQLFWDFYSGYNATINNLDVVYPHFKDINLFAETSKTILFDKQNAQNLSNKQFDDILLNRDISKNFDKMLVLFNFDQVINVKFKLSKEEKERQSLNNIFKKIKHKLRIRTRIKRFIVG